MKISVIIPTYRPQDYLWNCLSSLVNQTMDKNDFEVIVVLNGCKEPYDAQIQDFMSAKMRGLHIKLIQTDTPGVSNARNMGIEVAKGEYISFVDDDDWLSPFVLQEMMQLASPDAIVCCDVQCVHPTTNAISTDYLHNSYIRNKDARATLWSARSYFSTSCCKLIPKDLISTTRFDTHFAVGEDSLFMTQLAYRVKDIRFASDLAIYYRRLSPDSASRSHHSIGWWVQHRFRLMMAYLCAWARHPLIDPSFPLSRLIACVCR